MRSAIIVLVLLVIAFQQGMSQIDAQAANKTRMLIDQQILSQR